MDGDDVGVNDPAGGTGLGKESGLRRGVAAQVFGQHLDRHRRGRSAGHALEDNAHGALAKHDRDSIFPKLLADPPFERRVTIATVAAPAAVVALTHVVSSSDGAATPLGLADCESGS